MSLTLLYMS